MKTQLDQDEWLDEDDPPQKQSAPPKDPIQALKKPEPSKLEVKPQAQQEPKPSPQP